MKEYLATRTTENSKPVVIFCVEQYQQCPLHFDDRTTYGTETSLFSLLVNVCGTDYTLIYLNVIGEANNTFCCPMEPLHSAGGTSLSNMLGHCNIRCHILAYDHI